MRILIIEDSIILRENIAMGLRKLGHVVDEASDGEDELILANNARFTVTEIDEDVMLEFANGASIELEAVQVAEFENFFFG